MTIELNAIQKEAEKLAATNATFILFRGGAGSGKTFGICRMIFRRAMKAPGSRHAIFRSTAVDARTKIFQDTFKEMIEAECGAGSWNHLQEKKMINSTEMQIRLDNGSTILFAGLDDNAALNRVMGSNYATAFISECQLIETYDPVAAVETRLRQRVINQNTGKELPVKFYFDCNPPTVEHWTYLAFATHTPPPQSEPRVRVNPLTGLPHVFPDDYAEIKMDAEHNRANLAKGYLERLAANQDANGIEQYLKGEWRYQIDNPMFLASDINAARQPARLPGDCADLVRIEVAIDPAVSNKAGSDETGIIVVGVDANQHGYVLEDLSGKYHPEEWGTKAVEAYRRWNANTIVAEKNQGGNLVESNLRAVDPFVPVKLVHSSDSKQIRADSVAVAYKQRRIHHCGSFPELEGQLLRFESDFDRKRRGSPDRLDALVHGFNSALLGKQTKRGGASQKVANFWR